MMKKIFVCVSMQKSAEQTVELARECSRYVREKEMIPIAPQYLFHDETRNISNIENVDTGHEFFTDIRNILLFKLRCYAGKGKIIIMEPLKRMNALHFMPQCRIALQSQVFNIFIFLIHTIDFIL